jgi:Secretion system C-terminal sorting domain/Polysaccharide deacetylase
MKKQVTLFTSLFTAWLLGTTLYAQTITIQFDATPSTPPSVSKAFLKYNKDFAYSYTLDDATDDAITTALPLVSGGFIAKANETFPPLMYTDGCGNDIPFRLGIAWNTANLLGIDVHTGNVAGNLTWKQLDSLYDNGWDVMNHSFSHKSRWTNAMRDSDYVNEIERNRTAVRQRTRLRIETPLFVVPAGDDVYHDFAFRAGYSAVFNQNGNVSGFLGLNVEDNSFNFGSQAIFRRTLNESLEVAYYVDSVARRSGVGNKLWYNEFSHRIDNFNASAPESFQKFRDYMRRLQTLYGKSGSDKMWMAPMQEVYEYVMVRRTADFSQVTRGNQVDLNFNLRNLPSGLRRKTLSLVVNSNVDFSRVTVPTGVKMTFRGTGTAKLINLDFTDYTGPTDVGEAIAVSPKLYPNPTDDLLNVELPEDTGESVQLDIFDVSGKRHFSEKREGTTQQINTAILRGGIYFLNMRQGRSFYRMKFVKQ